MSMKNRFEEKTQNYQGCLLNHDFQRIFTINYLCIEYIICRSIFINRISTTYVNMRSPYCSHGYFDEYQI